MMKQLIKEATGFILDNPEISETIHHILTEWDDDIKAAFVLAYRLLEEDEE